MSDPRRWTVSHPDGPRVDTEGGKWWACDPYPMFFRREGNTIHLPGHDVKWQDDQPTAKVEGMKARTPEELVQEWRDEAHKLRASYGMSTREIYVADTLMRCSSELQTIITITTTTEESNR